MKSLLYLAALLFTFSSCTMKTGSGKIITEKRDLAPFTEIECTSSINVEITPAVTSIVEVEADDNIVSNILTRVKDGRLIISLEEGGYRDITATVYVSIPLIRKLISSGSGSVTTKGMLVNSEQMEVVATGSGNLSAEVTSPIVTANHTGSGSLEIKGRTRAFTADNTGSGALKCSALLAESATITNDGSGEAQVFASAVIKANLNGSGSILYRGNPASQKFDDDGSGEIKKMDN